MLPRIDLAVGLSRKLNDLGAASFYCDWPLFFGCKRDECRCNWSNGGVELLCRLVGNEKEELALFALAKPRFDHSCGRRRITECAGPARWRAIRKLHDYQPFETPYSMWRAVAEPQ